MKIHLGFKITVFLLVSLQIVLDDVEADGMIQVRFLKYENKDGKADNGHCCDGKWGICQANGCDHMFKICLDKPGGPHAIHKCAYGMRQSDSVKNQNTITFGGTIADLNNPLTFLFFEPLPREVVLKVAVYDKDSVSDHEFVEYLEQPINSISESPVDYTFGKRTKLQAQVYYTCTQNFYGPNCSTLCSPAPNNQYLCDPKSGKRICTLGWTGPDCSIQAGGHV